MELHNVQIAGNGRFIINDNIVVYDIDMGEEGMYYSVDWDDKKCNEAEAMALAESFLHKTIAGVLNNKDEGDHIQDDVYTPNK
jgi:hypothetical protein